MNFENKTLQENLNYLKLPTILQNYESAAAQCARTNLSHMEFLNELIAQEAVERLARSVKRQRFWVKPIQALIFEKSSKIFVQFYWIFASSPEFVGQV